MARLRRSVRYNGQKGTVTAGPFDNGRYEAFRCLLPHLTTFSLVKCVKSEVCMNEHIYIYIIISSAVICPKIFWLLQVMVFPARSQCLDVSAFDYSVTLCFSESEFLKPHRKVTCMDFAKFLIACISAGNSTSHRSRIDACETQRHVEDWTQLEMFVFTREQLCFR